MRGEEPQEVIAQRAGVRTQTISRLERGVNDPTFSTLLGVARALGVTVAELLDGVDRP